MRQLRISVTILFVITAVVFSIFYIQEKVTTDNTIPVISVEEEFIEVSFDATDEELLQGVTAYDEKDKDLTDKIIVESVSKFIDDGVCKVTYAVCDSNNNVANATRKIRYKNYESPKFSMKAATCYSIYESINISDVITAYDCIDGDITRSIIVTSEDFMGSVAGVFDIEVSVVNSKGDTSVVNIPLVVESRSPSAPKISLSEYLIYADVGETIDFSKYLVSAFDALERNITNLVRIEPTGDFTKEGIYSVHYYVTDSKGEQGHTILNVIVG